MLPQSEIIERNRLLLQALRGGLELRFGETILQSACAITRRTMPELTHLSIAIPTMNFLCCSPAGCTTPARSPLRNRSYSNAAALTGS